MPVQTKTQPRTATRDLVLTSRDVERLRQLIADSRTSGAERYEYLNALNRELDDARVVAAEDIPADVVTMNSTVRVRIDGGKRMSTFTVVYPEHADMDEDRVSVLAPIGTALLGYRVGDEVEWDVPAGRRRYRIEKIAYQPEASGDFDR